jgi:hypothetical protein
MLASSRFSGKKTYLFAFRVMRQNPGTLFDETRKQELPKGSMTAQQESDDDPGKRKRCLKIGGNLSFSLFDE